MNQHEDRGHGAPGAPGVGVLEGLVGSRPAAPADAAGGRPVSLRSSVDPFAAPDGDLYLLRSGDADLRIRDPQPADRAVVAALAERPWRAAELAQHLGLPADRLDEKLAALSAAGVLAQGSAAEPLDPGEALRFSRQLPYLAEAGDPAAAQRRLRSSSVVVIGCGGLGTWALAALASAGVGRFLLVDDDRVELSNLNRQIVYGEADLGTPKVEVASRWLAAFDARIDAVALARRIGGPDELPELVEDADAVIVAADTPPYHLARWVNAAAIERRVPFVLAGQAPPILKVGPIYSPGETACFACHELALRAASPHYDDYVEHAQHAAARSATLGPASGLVGATLGMELMQLLTGGRPVTLGAALITDMRTLATRREEVRRAADCPACQHLG